MDTTFPSLKSRKNKWRKQQDNCFFDFAFNDQESSKNYQVGFASSYHASSMMLQAEPFSGCVRSFPLLRQLTFQGLILSYVILSTSKARGNQHHSSADVIMKLFNLNI